jgi:hypothetical protein
MSTSTTLLPATEQARADTPVIPARTEAPVRRGGSIVVLDFGSEGNSAAYRTYGWSGQESSYVWSILDSSGMRLPNPFDRHPIVIDFDLNVCSSGGFLTSAVIRLNVNGRPVGSACVKGLSRVRFHVPADVIVPDEPIELQIGHPCFVRVDFLDVGHDDRPLGLCVYSVRAYPPWMQEEMDRFAPRPGTSGHVAAISQVDLSDDSPVESQTYRFGASEPGRSTLREGWVHDEDGNAWCTKRFNYIELPAPAQTAEYVARISICALYVRNILSSQRLSILLNGAVIGQFMTAADTVLTIPLPPELLLGTDVLRFALVAPNGIPIGGFAGQTSPAFLSFVVDSIEIRPAKRVGAPLPKSRGDDVAVARPLAISDMFIEDSLETLPDAIQRKIGIPVTELLRNFESLGDNCFFGGLQRRAGAEVLGLLRFGNTPIKALLRALDDDFKAVRDKSSISMRIQAYGPREWLLHVDRYGLRWHTDVLENTTDPEVVLSQHAMRLSYLVRKFNETLRSGRKIFTLARADVREQAHPVPLWNEQAMIRTPREPYRLAEVLSVFQEINRYGRNTVMYVTESTDAWRSGTVELISPGVMRGYVESLKLSPELGDREYASWLKVAANAWLLDQGPNASFRNTSTS